MSNINAHQEVKPQTIEVNSPILIDSAALGKKCSIRILHVDDDPSMQELTKLMLLDLDSSFEIDNACCVDEAFRKLAVGHYDVVVSDYEMPQKDGLQFLTDLRKQNTQIPFVLFTGKGREEVAIKALNLGADAYCNKQGDPETVYGELSHGIKRSVEHQKAKKQLQDQTNLLMKIASQTPGMLFQLMRQPNGTYCIPYTSEAIRNIFGCSPQEVREDFSPIVKVIVPKDMEKVIQSIEYSAKHLTAWQCEYRVQIPGQQIRWLWGQSMPEKLDDGSIVWNGYNTDVTEQKRTAETLADSEAKYRALIENADDAILLTDLRGKNIYRNRAHFKSLGFEEGDEAKIEELIKVHPDDVPLLKQKMSELFQTGYLTSEYRIKNSKGSWSYRHAKSAIIYNIRHQPYAIITIIRDITERKKAEEGLKTSEMQFRQLFSNMPSGVAVYEAVNDGKDYVFRDFNAAAERIEKIKKDKVIGKRVTEVFPGVENFGLFNVFKQVWQTGESEYYPLALYKDDKDLGTWRENWVYKLPNGNIVAIYNDITERKKTEVNLQKNKALLLEAEKAGKIGGWEFDINTLTQSWTDETFRILEIDLTHGEPIVPKGIEFINPPYRATANEAIQRAIEHGEPYDQEWEITTAKGNKRWVHAVAKANYENSKIKSISGSFQDITERKKAEEIRKGLESKVKQYSEHLKNMVDLRTAQLKDANERLVKSERLAAIGELAGMIGHDLRNPLAGIKNGVYFLKKKGTTISEAQSKETLEIIDKAIDHSNKIINDLLDYSREMNLKLIKYATRPLVDEAIRSIQVPDRIEIVNHVDEEACIWVDADKMIRVFVNLLQNAIDATPESGRLEITSCQQSNHVEITFADTGKGIPAEILPKLFTPLFTTKAQGMGFGLAICKRIVEVHGGTIKVESVKDKGTKFIINLPVKNYHEPKETKLD